MEAVADVIRRGNADIVCLAEVENEAALNALNSNFLQGMAYNVSFAQGIDTFTGQDMGLLSRIDPTSYTYDPRSGTSGNESKSVSKNFVATFGLGGTKIAMIGLHLLAQPNRQDRVHKRQAQADAVRQMAIEKAQAGFEVVVLGDFNDYDGNPDSIDHADSTPITTVLRSIRAMSGSDPADDLFNAAALNHKANRYTSLFDSNQDDEAEYPDEFTAIDHILLSRNLFDKVSISDVLSNHDPTEVSDHFPVVVKIALGGGPTPAPPPTADISVRIHSLLPNPQGDESQDEGVTLVNAGSEPVDVSTWRLRDRANTHWNLTELGTLQPGEQKTIKRNGQAMALNNGGDRIELVDGSIVRHFFEYDVALEEEVIVVAP